MSRGVALHLAVAAFSLALNTQLPRIFTLGYYQDDFNNLALLAFRDEGYASFLLGRLLTDEPLFRVYQAIQYAVFGLDAAAWQHLWLALLDSLNIVLAYSLVRRLWKDELGAAVFALLLLSYPQLGEARYWPAAPYVPLMAIVLASAHTWLSFIRTGRQALFRWTLALWSILAFSHEAMLGLVGIYPALWIHARGFSAARRAMRSLLPFAYPVGAYLLLRQTAWFGFGQRAMADVRPIESQGIPFVALDSFRSHFGDLLLARIASLLAEVTPLEALLWLGVFGVCGACLLAVVEPSRRRLWAAEGYATAIASTLALAFILAGPLQRPQPDGFVGLDAPYFVLRVALVVAVAAALVAWTAIRLGSSGPTLPGVAGLALFGLCWFVCAYAPTYLYYFSFRHGYIPAFGAALLIAAALWLPSAAVRAERAQALCRGAGIGLAVTLAACFYSASMAEARRWERTSEAIDQVRRQVLEVGTGLGVDDVLIVLGLPVLRQDVPMLADWAFRKAVPLWLDEPHQSAGTSVELRDNGFLWAVRLTQPVPYGHLWLFDLVDGRLEPVHDLTTPSGQAVVLSPIR